MDFTLSLSSDWFNLMSFPLILITIRDVIPKWKTIWDKNLTMEDRRLIMRIVIFLALPVVVFVHEVGHLLAALQVGAKVYEFHYGPVTGHVKVEANIPEANRLWIAVAGNLAQVLFGLAALVLALLTRSAPMVAFLVYLGLFSIGDTVIFYAALSLASIYGDWVQIYTNPCTNLVMDVGAVHLILVAFVLYCINGTAPRIWFTKKTMPSWSKKNLDLEEDAFRNPSTKSLVALADSYMEAGLYKEAERSLKKAESVDGESSALTYSRAYLEMNKGNVDKALKCFDELIDDESISNPMRAQILLQIGDIWLYRRAPEKALDYYEAAVVSDPMQGDARLQKAILSANSKNFAELAQDIKALKDPNVLWVYRRNQENSEKEIAKLESILERS